MRNETKKVLDELHVKMKKIDDPVVNMSGGQRQGIAIGRAIYFDARVLIMDEPTAALGPEETRMVGQLIKRLKTQGVGIILISHDINDVFDLSDRLTIMAGGRVVDTLLTKDTDEDEVLGYDHHLQIKTHWWSEGRDVSIICGFRAKTRCYARRGSWAGASEEIPCMQQSKGKIMTSVSLGGVIVTGAARGIGIAIARNLAETGYGVVIADIDNKAGTKAVEDIKAKGGKAIYCNVDVSNRASVATSVAACEKAFSFIFAIVNNAGFNRPQHFLETTEDN